MVEEKESAYMRPHSKKKRESTPHHIGKTFTCPRRKPVFCGFRHDKESLLMQSRNCSRLVRVSENLSGGSFCILLGNYIPLYSKFYWTTLNFFLTVQIYNLPKFSANTFRNQTFSGCLYKRANLNLFFQAVYIKGLILIKCVP